MSLSTQHIPEIIFLSVLWEHVGILLTAQFKMASQFTTMGVRVEGVTVVDYDMRWNIYSTDNISSKGMLSTEYLSHFTRCSKYLFAINAQNESL